MGSAVRRILQRRMASRRDVVGSSDGTRRHGGVLRATVRAPVTGMVLVIEMTATTSVAVPMMAATAAAVLAAYLVRSQPIYDSLRERMPVESTPGEGDGSSAR